MLPHVSSERTVALTHSRLDFFGADPLEAVLQAVNAGFTGLYHSNRRSYEGFRKAMSARQTTSAIVRTAGAAGSAASLLLGSILLLIPPSGPAGHVMPGRSGDTTKEPHRAPFERRMREKEF